MAITNEQITQLALDMQARLDKCAQTGEAYRVKWHDVKSLIAVITTLQERLAEANDFNNDVVDREAAVCPEDVPFDEYIRSLEQKLATARADAIGEAIKIADEAGEQWGDQARDRKSKTYSAYAIAALEMKGRLESLIQPGEQQSS